MQVDPIKPALKGAGIKRLKLKYYELLSNFPFKFNLRRYNKVRPAEKERILARVNTTSQSIIELRQIFN